MCDELLYDKLNKQNGTSMNEQHEKTKLMCDEAYYQLYIRKIYNKE